ncbi:MAG: hypothetical protein ACKN9V_08925 [Pseudomonadota bacterium]
MYGFSTHQNRFKRALSFLPWLFLIHSPEGALGLVQKYFETEWADSPKLSFLILYPLFCAVAALSSAATYLIIKSYPEKPISFNYLIKEIKPKLIFLVLTSWLLGVLIIPATLAFVFPGIWVLSQYLFVPFCIMDSSDRTLSSFFNLSKVLSEKNRKICLLTAFLSFMGSLLSFVGGMGLMSQVGAPLGLLLILETTLSVLISVFITTWTATLYQEVSNQ